MSEIGEIFQDLPRRYAPGYIKKPMSFYFSLDEDEKWTVRFTPEVCEVAEGRSDADCFFKGSKQLFLDVWNGRYTPSAMDFLTGKIKSNNPIGLKDFLLGFGKKV
jgi:putative sterol carrier protein